MAPEPFEAERLQRLMVGPTTLVERVGRRLDNERMRRFRARFNEERERVTERL